MSKDKFFNVLAAFQVWAIIILSCGITYKMIYDKYSYEVYVGLKK